MDRQPITDVRCRIGGRGKKEIWGGGGNDRESIPPGLDAGGG